MTRQLRFSPVQRSLRFHYWKLQNPSANRKAQAWLSREQPRPTQRNGCPVAKSEEEVPNSQLYQSCFSLPPTPCIGNRQGKDCWGTEGGLCASAPPDLH